MILSRFHIPQQAQHEDLEVEKMEIYSGHKPGVYPQSTMNCGVSSTRQTR